MTMLINAHEMCSALREMISEESTHNPAPFLSGERETVFRQMFTFYYPDFQDNLRTPPRHHLYGRIVVYAHGPAKQSGGHHSLDQPFAGRAESPLGIRSQKDGPGAGRFVG